MNKRSDEYVEREHPSFFSALTKDAVLQSTFEKMNDRAVGRFNGAAPDEEQLEKIFREELLPAIREAGFSFSFQDWKEFAEESKEAAALSEDELSAVSAARECIGIGTENTQSMWCKCISSGSGQNL